MDGITTQEMAQTRIHRMRWWTLAVVSVTVVLATIDETILRGGLVCLNSAARFDKWNRAAVR